MPTTPSQAIITSGTDPALDSIYASSLQSLPIVTGANIYITTKQEFVNNYISENAAGGSEEQVQFNIGGRVVGDSGMTYDMETDSLTVVNLKSDNILYANGSPWVFSTYSNANVGQYLNSGTFSGNITANNFSANTYSGNAAGLRNITAANIVGSIPSAVYAESAGAVSSIAGANVIGAVANATYATSSGSSGSAATAQTVTQGAQANITSVGTLSSLTVSGTLQAGLFSGSGANLTNIPAGNILGTVASATSATTATSATSATTAGTVTTAAQPNITSVGTLSGLTVSGTSGLNAVTANTLTVGSSTPFYVYANGVSNVTSTAASINTTSGALKVAGGLGVAGNIHAGMIESTGNLVGLLGLFGDNAQGTTFVNPVIIAKSTGTDYIQAAIINSTDTGSSDFTAYGDNGDEGTAWVDMGFTGSNFADPNYTITGPNDGYVFAQGSGGLGGNLVLASGNLGYSVHRDIIFATGGFLAENERMRLNHESLSLDISTQQPASNTTTGSFRVDGGAGITGNVHIGGKLYANTLNLSATGTSLDIGAGNMLLNKATGNSFAFMNGGFTVTMTAVGSATADYTLTLPTTAGTNGQVLTTNGSGDLSWSTKPVTWTTAPVSNVSSGTAGDAAYDSGGNLFVCVATNQWAKFGGTTSW